MSEKPCPVAEERDNEGALDQSTSVTIRVIALGGTDLGGNFHRSRSPG
jgi:hypothetical protein